MKQPIEWHKNCLRNMLASAERKQAEAKRAEEDAARLYRDCNALDAQIIEATLRGLDGFDCDKFGKKRTG